MGLARSLWGDRRPSLFTSAVGIREWVRASGESQTEFTHARCIPKMERSGKRKKLRHCSIRQLLRESQQCGCIPSQPLMRSSLSRFHIPIAPRRNSRFFRMWLPVRSPWQADHLAYFGLTSFISPILSVVDADQTKQLCGYCRHKHRRESEISVNGIVENRDNLSTSGGTSVGR